MGWTLQRSCCPRQITPRLLPPSPCPPCRGSCWLPEPLLGNTEQFLLQAGRTCGFWNSGLDKCSLVSTPPEAKGQASGTGNWMLSGPSCLLLLRSLEPVAMQLLQPELCTEAWPAHILTSTSCPCQSWRSWGRTGALSASPSSRLDPASSQQRGRAHVLFKEQFPQHPRPQRPRHPPFPPWQR